MKNYIILFILICSFQISAQNNALILNGAVRVNIDGGAMLIIDQTSTQGIALNGTGTGIINSEAENNRVAWIIRTGTGNYVIPFGSNDGDQIPLSYNITAPGTGNGALVASTWRTTDYANNPRPTGVSNTGAQWIWNGSNYVYEERNHYCVDRFWLLTDAGMPWTAKPTSTLTFTYSDWEDNVNGGNVTALNNSTNLGAQYWTSGQWTPGWFTGNIPLGSVTGTRQVSGVQATNGNLFPWVLVLKDNPLPIELLYFSLNCSGDGVNIEWGTASEVNNDYFYIRRSDNGIVWESLAIIPGAGNSNQPLFYSFFDFSGKEKNYIYQLIQVDFDGTQTIVGTKQSNCASPFVSEPSEFYAHIFSDGENNIYLSYFSEQQEENIFKLYDINGKLIDSWKLQAQQGYNHFTIQVNNVSQAIYLASLRHNNTITTQKVLLK